MHYVFRISGCSSIGWRGAPGRVAAAPFPFQISMRSSHFPALALTLSLVPSIASAAAAPAGEARGGLLTPHGGLMFWTLVIFVILFFVLAKAAFPKILGAVEARERALAEAIEGAKRDREEASRLLAEQQQRLDAARAETLKLIAEGRATAEKLRAEMLEQTRQQQQEMLERARQDVARERDKAIADLRREAVSLAIAGASKVIERNLDDDANRRLVESFLSSVPVGVGGR